VRDWVCGLLGNDHRDPVTEPHASVGERVSQPIRTSVEVPEGVRLALPIGVRLKERDLSLRVVVLSQQVVGDVVAVGNVPLEILAGLTVGVVVEREIPGHADT